MNLFRMQSAAMPTVGMHWLLGLLSVSDPLKQPVYHSSQCASLMTMLLRSFESHGYLGGTSRNPANTLPLLTQLTSLRLSVTGLRDLPRGISRLTGLQALHFAGNQLDPNHALSQTLVPLTALTKLVLQQCSLNAVPDGLSALSGLQWLCLSQNSLQLVPCGMPWQRLRALHLRFNELKSMPCTALSRASQLQHLDCGDNFPMQASFLAWFPSSSWAQTLLSHMSTMPRAQLLHKMSMNAFSGCEVCSSVRFCSIVPGTALLQSHHTCCKRCTAQAVLGCSRYGHQCLHLTAQVTLHLTAQVILQLTAQTVVSVKHEWLAALVACQCCC